MDKLFILWILGYLFVVFFYIILLKIRKSKEFYFRLVLISFIPAFGLLFFVISDIWSLFSRKLQIENKKVRELESEILDLQITSSENSQEEEHMALADIMGMDDIKMRRKKLFKEINGDIAKISPFLKKFLGDSDSEISHYAAAIITGTRQKVNTVCDDMRRLHLKDLDNMEHVIGFTDSLMVYIHSGLFAEDEVMKRRYELLPLLEKLFSVEKVIDEKYYIERIENELIVNRKTSAINICREFAQVYPHSEKPYQMFLKLFFVIGDKKYFFKVLSYIRENNIAYSRTFDAMLRFWEKAI